MVAQEARRRRLGNLVFRPYQPRARLAESLGAADLHLISLRPEVEGWIVPSKLYGIAAAGRPTLFIGAAEGEIASLLHETGCGVRVAPGDAARLSGLIREWVRHPEEAARRARKARAVFEQRFGQGSGLQARRRLLLAEPLNGSSLLAPGLPVWSCPAMGAKVLTLCTEALFTGVWDNRAF